MKDTISIIIPVYNVEKYLKKCIKSIINQTYTNIEIILVDDGSTDNSGKICDEFKNKDNRIIVIHKENQGLSSARNIGIENSTGKYIAFVDSDDYILKDMYEKLYKNLIENNADISICKYQYIKENEETNSRLDTNELITMNNVQAMKRLLLNKKITNHVCNKLYKREIFDKIEFPVGKKYEDIATMYLLFEQSNKIVYQDTSKYAYINRDGSILHNKNNKLIQDYITIINNRYEYLSQRYKELKEELDYNLLFSILQYHIIAIGGKQKEFYNSEIMINEYKKIKKIMKEDKKNQTFKNLAFKYKIFLCMILFNRNFAYKLFVNMYK